MDVKVFIDGKAAELPEGIKGIVVISDTEEGVGLYAHGEHSLKNVQIMLQNEINWLVSSLVEPVQALVLIDIFEESSLYLHEALLNKMEEWDTNAKNGTGCNTCDCTGCGANPNMQGHTEDTP